MAGIKPIQPLYYRRKLNGAEAAIYDALVSAALAGQATAQADSLRNIDLSRPLLAAQHDHPELFYWDAFGTSYTMYGSGLQVQYRMTLKYLYPLSEVPARQKRIAGRVSELLEGLESCTPFERALRVHDALALSVSYGHEKDRPIQYNTIEGPLAMGKGVCGGMARAYVYLMNLAGVFCIEVHGDIIQSDGSPALHAWNIIHVDGCCHHVDLTWNDNDDAYLSHAYFAVSDTEILYSHTLEGGGFQLPRCATSRCPVITARSIPEISDALIAQYAMKRDVTETRVFNVPEAWPELYQKMQQYCVFGKKGRAFNHIKAWNYNPRNHILAAHWR